MQKTEMGSCVKMLKKITPIANDSMLEITFANVGTKKVMANFAPVTKID